jgi:NADH dehydrogenase
VKRIIIAGAGFTGISALKPLGRFARTAPECEIIVFDKNAYTTMIPLLPDVAAKRINQNLTKVIIEDLLPERVLFVNEEIKKIDLDAQSIAAGSKDYEYDYLLLSAGSITNYFGFNQHLDSIFVLDSLTGALKIEKAFSEYLRNRKSPILLISGAGFTGIETACALKAYTETKSKAIDVVLVEKTDKVLGNLPVKVSTYVESLISDLGFKVVMNSSVSSFDGHNITLETGEVFEDVFFIWTSGTRRALQDITGSFTSLNDGRVIVNEFLQVLGYGNVFAAGDSAALKSGTANLRKAVAFSAASGKSAGGNIVRSLKNKRLKKYRPVDLGWIIPLYPSSIGRLLGVNVKGRLGISLQYLACGYRSHGLKNRIGYSLQALRALIGAG